MENRKRTGVLHGAVCRVKPALVAGIQFGAFVFTPAPDDPQLTADCCVWLIDDNGDNSVVESALSEEVARQLVVDLEAEGQAAEVGRGPRRSG